MEIYLAKSFKKQYKKQTHKTQVQFKKRRDLFLENPFNPLLNNHALDGKWTGYRSIAISGDHRVIYEQINSNTVYFIAIGTHSQLYN